MNQNYDQLLKIIQGQQEQIDSLLAFKNNMELKENAPRKYYKNIHVFDRQSLLGLFGADPVAKITGLTTITHTSPSTPDYALQDLTNITPYGFATKDEGNTLLSVVKNIQQALKTLGITT